MPDIKSLGLKREQIEGKDLADLPDPTGAPQAPLPLGTYRFKLPGKAALSTCYEKVSTTIKDKPAERITAVLRDAAALTITQSRGGKMDGEPYGTRISNVERKRDRDGNVYASDFDYLLRALGDKVKPRDNEAYAAALERHAEGEFLADSEWSAYCNDKQDIYADDGQGGQSKVEGQKGCGARYYQSAIPKREDGELEERFLCGGKGGQCGASLRVFSNLTRFRGTGA